MSRSHLLPLSARPMDLHRLLSLYCRLICSANCVSSILTHVLVIGKGLCIRTFVSFDIFVAHSAHLNCHVSFVLFYIDTYPDRLCL